MEVFIREIRCDNVIRDQYDCREWDQLALRSYSIHRFHVTESDDDNLMQAWRKSLELCIVLRCTSDERTLLERTLCIACGDGLNGVLFLFCGLATENKQLPSLLVVPAGESVQYLKWRCCPVWFVLVP